MGYVSKEFGQEGEGLSVVVRGKEYAAKVTKFPLVVAKTKK
jgi:glycine cleavage system aminomethyltransferase T